MKSEPSSLSTPLFHYFLFQHSQSQRPGDKQRNRERKETERKSVKKGDAKDRRPMPGWTLQRRMTVNEIGELKEGNEKRKVKVEMQEDCILLQLLCALRPHSLSNGACLICCLEACLFLPSGVGLKIQSEPQHHLRPQRTNFD